jgi:hypothetical protein
MDNKKHDKQIAPYGVKKKPKMKVPEIVPTRTQRKFANIKKK